MGLTPVWKYLVNGGSIACKEKKGKKIAFGAGTKGATCKKVSDLYNPKRQSSLKSYQNGC